MCVFVCMYACVCVCVCAHMYMILSTVKMCVCFQDTIRGMMGWKKFPSQGLTSLANIPTLTNVWVPRWLVSICIFCY